MLQKNKNENEHPTSGFDSTENRKLKKGSTRSTSGINTLEKSNKNEKEVLTNGFGVAQNVQVDDKINIRKFYDTKLKLHDNRRL